MRGINGCSLANYIDAEIRTIIIRLKDEISHFTTKTFRPSVPI